MKNSNQPDLQVSQSMAVDFGRTMQFDALKVQGQKSMIDQTNMNKAASSSMFKPTLQL